MLAARSFRPPPGCQACLSRRPPRRRSFSPPLAGPPCAAGLPRQVSLSAEYGSQATNIYTLAVTKPKPWGRPLLADVRLHQLGHNYQPWSSYAEVLRGGQVTLSRWGAGWVG